MTTKDYHPQPIDTVGLVLSDALQDLTERLAENNHDTWAITRLDAGWCWGPRRDDERKEHQDLVPYAELSEEEKNVDRATVTATLKAVLALGYRIEGPSTTPPRR